jgi:hypothetical protein
MTTNVDSFESFHRWPGCDPLVASVLERIEAECRHRPPHTRYRSMLRMVGHQLQPALLACIRASTGNTLAFDVIFHTKGLANSLDDPACLDRDLCHLASIADEKIDETVDAIRQFVRWVAYHKPARVVPRGNRHLKGEIRHKRGTVEFTDYAEWPYCKLCGELSQLAEIVSTRYLSGINSVPGTNEDDVSPNFCRNHDPTLCPSGYKRAIRKFARFECIHRAIGREQKIDSRFRQRFSNQAFKGLNPEDVGNEESIYRLANSQIPASLILNPTEQLARRYASKISQEDVNPRTVLLAELMSIGMSSSDATHQLGISPQATSQMIKKSRGFFDFTRHSTLLFWWPDSEVLEGHFSF